MNDDHAMGSSRNFWIKHVPDGTHALYVSANIERNSGKCKEKYAIK
jgi:hypothetical protein